MDISKPSRGATRKISRKKRILFTAVTLVAGGALLFVVLEVLIIEVVKNKIDSQYDSRRKTNDR